MDDVRDSGFYIGYEGPPPPEMAARVRGFVAVAAVAALVVAGVVVTAQRPFADARFDYGQPREWAGRLVLDPHPALLDLHANTRTLVVGPGKFGADTLVRGFAGHDVVLVGEGITRGAARMVQLRPGAIADAGYMARTAGAVSASVSLGRVTLRGEVVDGKCFLGVMNPGERAVHRDCAVRCISGGIPPMLAVRRAGGGAVAVVLVSPEGAAMGRELLDLAGQTVDVTGELERRQDLLYLRAAREAYRVAGR